MKVFGAGQCHSNLQSYIWGILQVAHDMCSLWGANCDRDKKNPFQTVIAGCEFIPHLVKELSCFVLSKSISIHTWPTAFCSGPLLYRKAQANVA